MPAEGKTPAAKRLEDMTQEERLQSLQAFAEEKKYIQPGGGEILPASSGTGAGGYNSVLFGNEWQGGAMSFKMAKPAYDVENLPPPSYNTATGAEPKEPQARKPSIFKQAMDKMHHKAHEKEDHHVGGEGAKGTE